MSKLYQKLIFSFLALVVFGLVRSDVAFAQACVVPTGDLCFGRNVDDIWDRGGIFGQYTCAANNDPARTCRAEAYVELQDADPVPPDAPPPGKCNSSSVPICLTKFEGDAVYSETRGWLRCVRAPQNLDNPPKCTFVLMAQPPKPTVNPLPSGTFDPNAPLPTIGNFSNIKFESFDTLIMNLYALLFPIALGYGLFTIIKSGYFIKVSEGDPQKFKAATEDLMSAITGLVFILLSSGILWIIIRALF